jgi:hypothetical protein
MKKRILLVAVALLVLATAVLMTELQEPPRHTPEPTSPLTDVAAAAPGVELRPEEEPSARQGARSPDPLATATPGASAPVPRGPEAPPARVVPPSLMPDPANPPQGTRPLALPSTPSPPDPFMPPPIAVDPERGRAPVSSDRELRAP